MKWPLAFTVSAILIAATLLSGCAIFIPTSGDSIQLGGDKFDRRDHEIKQAYKKGELSEKRYRKLRTQVRRDRRVDFSEGDRPE